MLFERSEFIGSRPAAQFSRIDRRSGGFFCFLFSAGGKKEVPVRHEDIPNRPRPVYTNTVPKGLCQNGGLPSSALAVGRKKKTERQGEKGPMLFERSEFIGSRRAAQFSRVDRRSGGFLLPFFS
jgi:hypothetical protein